MPDPAAPPASTALNEAHRAEAHRRWLILRAHLEDGVALSQVAEREGWAVPSYATVYAIIADVDPALRTLAVEGSKRYAEVFELIYRRQAARPNEIWQADHTLLDLWVVTPLGKPGRPWLTVIEDDHSRAIAGYAVNLDAPSALQTALALRQAIWRKSEPGWHVCGIPDAFYTDHGPDFTSRHLEQAAIDLKIRLVFSRQGKPPAAAERSSGTSTPSTRCACPPCPGTPPAAPLTGPARRACRWPNPTRRSAGSSSASTTTARTARPASHPRPAGTPAGSCRTCPTRWSAWTCCC